MFDDVVDARVVFDPIIEDLLSLFVPKREDLFGARPVTRFDVTAVVLDDIVDEVFI